MTTGYIFDYGGTLDTGGSHWAKVLWHAYRVCGLAVAWEPFSGAYVEVERALGRGTIIEPTFTFRRTLEVKIAMETEWLAAHGCCPAAADELRRRVLTYIYNKVTATTAHSRDVLQRLAAPKVLVTNFYGNIGTVLREFGLERLFAAVVESAAVGLRKPDERLLALGVQALGMEAGRVTAVGDSLTNDIVPAKSIGCRTAWLRGEPWDDRPAGVPPVGITSADRILTSLDQLLTTDE